MIRILKYLYYILFFVLLFGNLYVTQAQSTGSSSDSITFVKDAKGNLYTINATTGQATHIGKASDGKPAGTLLFDNKTVASDRAIAVFEPAETGKYAFDTYNPKYAESLLFSEKYEELRTYGSEAYQVPFKLIPAGATDVVQVTVTRTELQEGFEMKAIDPDKIVFRTAAGAEYKPKVIEKQDTKTVFELTLPSAKANDGYELYALHPMYAANNKGYKYDMLGKLTVVSYSMEMPKVVLVAVNGNTAIDQNDVKAYIDKVYLPVGINWQVGEITDFTYNIPRDSLDVLGSGMFSRYTPAMKQMNAAFMQRDDYDPATLYIFVLQRASLDNTSGDMPRGCQFGYIFTGAITDAAKSGMSKNEIIGRTIAHELGHGMFKLKHTFDSEYRIAQSSTENVMDYSWGTDYVKHQWDAIHEPGLVIGMFERDEDGMIQRDYIMDCDFLVKDGKINNDAFILKHQAGTDMYNSNVIKQMINTSCIQNNIQNIIFFPSAEHVASIQIGFIVKSKYINKDVFVIKTIDELTTLSNLRICFTVNYNLGRLTSKVLYPTYDMSFAHELLIHGVHFANEINKIDLKNISYEELKEKIKQIYSKSYYLDKDGGDRDHALFITGEKKEMTNYILDRLNTISDETHKMVYLCDFIGGLGKYVFGNYPAISKKQGGQKALIEKVRKYLKRDFKQYDDLIFKPLPESKRSSSYNNQISDQKKSLWDNVFKK